MARFVSIKCFWVKIGFFTCKSDVDHSQVFRHKTKRKFGSAMLTLPKQLYQSLQGYLTNPIKGEYIFPGTKPSLPMSAWTVAKQEQSAWSCGGNQSIFTTVKWRKSVITVVSHFLVKLNFLHQVALLHHA